ncbi:Universal stress protein family protein [Rubripirellula lacrimiformis]|uniref:Universal stress protein family protein n=1 Tax=Rubripirellula lacrimiformis TaxID=1930273 RepID=A0A517NIP9_9BACT|nr:universal stress protein [Rubripirellula lacrimiformis]QDT07010.1 Universal stress protein family protein [Rubripirellula lacrimiformis]
MGNESESNEIDRDVDESMRMFERSKVGTSHAIAPIRPSRILVALDGSPQDVTSLDAAMYLRERFNVESILLDARDKADDDSSDLAIDAATKVTGSRPAIRSEGDAYEAILKAIEIHDVDLVILPCPFGRNFEQVGSDSAGTVVDVMLSRCPCPMLIIRRDDQSLRRCAAQVRLVIGGECDVEERAAAWAFGMADAGAMVTLNLVVEKEQYQNLRAILEALQPGKSIELAQFSDALTKTHQSLHGAMSKSATELGMQYSLRPQAGEVAPPNPLNESNAMLIVMPIEVDDRFTQGFVNDRIRRSPHPVLVVPGHVPS